ncbi:helix-turn-helix domain-containing protein [Methanomassiliicoccus luminyensis]|uniref:helix-turn-helix domain-containing protein n=1 Tax=Methanomassiliicoccus luminyensis TaxID=1080712 RepID=UPI00138AF517|nr:helix-turn-helix domain-containing protein [Methanomassiliicoccus luminyensis]
MRKMIVQLRPGPELQELMEDFYGSIESMAVLEFLGISHRMELRLALMELRLRPGTRIEDVSFPDKLEIAEVLRSDGNTYLVLGDFRVGSEDIMPTLSLSQDLVWTTPLTRSRERIVFGCIGNGKDLKAVLDRVKDIGTIEDVNFVVPHFKDESLLSALPKRQREVLCEAYRSGYYEYPRKINANELAAKMGLTKATVVEHLRRGERRLLAEILAGR